MLKLTDQDIATVLKALAAMPLGEALNTFVRIQQQLAEQQAGTSVAERANGADTAPSQ